MTTGVKPDMKYMQLSESDVYTQVKSENIDEENGVIRNVKLLGKLSENGVEYSDSAMEEGVHLYEGVTVNIDHPERDNPKKERGVMESIGFVKDPRYNKKDDGIFGDIHYYKTHPYAATLLERARRNPRGFGMSHNADGAYVKANGKTVIERLRTVRSMDVVGKPATTKGLFESEDPDNTPEEKVMKKYSLKQLVESFGSTDAKRNLPLLEEAAILDREVEIEEPKEDATGVTEIGIAQAIADINSGGGTAQEKLDEIEKVLAASAALKKPEVKEEPVEKPSGESQELESLREENRKMKLEKTVMTLCESESFRPDELEMKALCLMESSEERLSLIEKWKGRGKPSKSSRKTQIEGLGTYEEELAKLQPQA